MSAVNEFLAARDFLLQHRSDYATAYAGFKWPKLKEFNWALDYFDAMAKGNDNPALWIIEEDGSESKLSFAEMSARSNRVANWLRKHNRSNFLLTAPPLNLPGAVGSPANAIATV